VAALKGTFLEINEKGNNLSIQDIKTIKNSGAGIIVNSDAHKPSAVGNFKKSIELIKLSGLLDADIVNANYDKGPIFRR